MSCVWEEGRPGLQRQGRLPGCPGPGDGIVRPALGGRREDARCFCALTLADPLMRKYPPFISGSASFYRTWKPIQMALLPRQLSRQLLLRPTQSDPRGMRLATCATPLQTLPSSRGLRSRPDPRVGPDGTPSTRRDRPLLLHPSQRAGAQWWHRWLRPAGIQADPDSGQFSRQDSALPLQAGGGDSAPPPGHGHPGLFWLSWRHELPTPQAFQHCLSPAHDLTLCVICCCRCLGFFFKLQSFIGFC